MLNKDFDKIVFQIFNPLSQIQIIKEIWISLTNKCPHSYWLSWEWNEIWLNNLPNDCELYLIAGFMDEAPVIAFFAGYKEIIRHRYFKVYQIAVNQTLVPFFDALTYIEYNTILIDPKITISLESLLKHIPIRQWDEFYLTRYSIAYQPNLVFSNNTQGKYIFSIKSFKSYYVNLNEVRAKNYDYLALLSPNRRYQIRRSLKEYEKMGKIQIHISENVDDALRIFDELIQLHQKSWIERGKPGVFSSEFDVSYHKKLISKRFASNEIQLIKVSAGEHTIGCLYNYIYRGSVLQIQGGFNYLPGNLHRPGFICHYFAIMHNAKIGLSCYDFLVGTTDYKETLSTSNNEMVNIYVQNKSIKYYLENILVLVYHVYSTTKKYITKITNFSKNVCIL